MDNTLAAVTSANFKADVLDGSSAQLVLVDFWAQWCGPCRMLAPVLQELAKDLDGKVKIVKVDVDQEKGLASQYQVSAIPTLLLFKNGQPVEKIVGMTSKKELTEKITAHAG